MNLVINENIKEENKNNKIIKSKIEHIKQLFNQFFNNIKIFQEGNEDKEDIFKIYPELFFSYDKVKQFHVIKLLDKGQFSKVNFLLTYFVI